jgi:hypothetical protein
MNANLLFLALAFGLSIHTTIYNVSFGLRKSFTLDGSTANLAFYANSTCSQDSLEDSITLSNGQCYGASGQGYSESFMATWSAATISGPSMMLAVASIFVGFLKTMI